MYRLAGPWITGEAPRDFRNSLQEDQVEARPFQEHAGGAQVFGNEM